MRRRRRIQGEADYWHLKPSHLHIFGDTVGNYHQHNDEGDSSLHTVGYSENRHKAESLSSSQDSQTVRNWNWETSLFSSRPMERRVGHRRTRVLG